MQSFCFHKLFWCLLLFLYNQKHTNFFVDRILWLNGCIRLNIICSKRKHLFRLLSFNFLSGHIYSKRIFPLIRIYIRNYYVLHNTNLSLLWFYIFVFSCDMCYSCLVEFISNVLSKIFLWTSNIHVSFYRK